MINYYLITKPGIVFGNLVTLAAGFLLGSSGKFDILLFLATFLGLALVMASSCILNNDINRETDKKMERTKNRAMVVGAVSRNKALLLACFLGLVGEGILLYGTNLTTAAIAAFGFFVYVVIYSFWKCRTIYGTAIGSIAGAVPPIVGYTAASQQLDMGALILFAILVFWQMPHFFSIAIYHFDDYLRADVPVFPVKKGIALAKIRMAIYIVAFMFTASLLTFFGYTGNLYLALTAFVGSGWLFLCLKGFSTANDQLWGKQMFIVSLVMIMSLCLVIPFDVKV